MHIPERFGGVPIGGNDNDQLIKESNANFETAWAPIPKKSHTHTQSTPSNIWQYVHDLGQYPIIEVYTTAHDLVASYKRENISINEVKLTFSAAFAGYTLNR